MTDLKRDVQDDRGIKKRVIPKTQPPRVNRARTEGEDRDFDESGRSVNQGHGHPREERSRQRKRPARPARGEP